MPQSIFGKLSVRYNQVFFILQPINLLLKCGKIFLSRHEFLLKIKEGETRRFSPGRGLRKFPQHDH